MKEIEKNELSTKLRIDVWADVLCPWCYIGEERLNKAIEASEHGQDIEIQIHTFMLAPDTPKTVEPLLAQLAAQYGMGQNQARSMEQQIAQQAAREGLRYEADRMISNSFDMLRLIHLGNKYNAGWRYLRMIQAEVFSGSKDAFGHETLIRLGEELGIPSSEIRDVLGTDRYADDVYTDHNAAVNMGATGVPFAVIGNQIGIPGAVSVAQYSKAINDVWETIND